MFVGLHSLQQSLFGLQGFTEGLWRRKDGSWRNKHVSAVMFGLGLSVAHPPGIVQRLPVLWHNPQAVHPLPTDLDLPVCYADDVALETHKDGACHEPGRPPWEVFGLPEDWPSEAQPDWD